LPGDTIYNDTAKIVYSGEAHKIDFVKDKDNKSNDVVAPLCYHHIYMTMAGDYIVA